MKSKLICWGLLGLMTMGAIGAARLGPESNLFADPSFETTRRGEPGQAWHDFADKNPKAWIPYQISDGAAHDGEHAAMLVMDSDVDGEAQRVYGVYQEVECEVLPRYISGYYRVEDWQRGTTKQYLQVVLIIWNAWERPRGLTVPNYQVAITLAGVDEQPLHYMNRAFEITGPLEPVEDEWVFFEFDLHDLFDKHWGVLPRGFDYVRTFFEVRYDNRHRVDAVCKAKVYFDDLYIGDESRAPKGD